MHDLKKVEEKLRKRLSVLRDRMEEIDDDLGEVGDDDWSEMATESEGDEVLEKLGHMAGEEEKQILLALERIEGGVYGKCRTCGASIAPKRLDAVPYATRCIKCAQD